MRTSLDSLTDHLDRGERGIRSRPLFARVSPAPVRPSAFTLIELLVVVAIIGILAALLLPVLSKGKQRAQGVNCMNNGKQLMLAVTLYASDNHEFFPPNPDDGTTEPGHNWCPGQAGIGQDAEFNPDILKDPSRSLLSHYLAGNVAIFQCPADRRSGPYQGAAAELQGQVVPAARSFAMSQAVGTIDPGYHSNRVHSGVPTLPVDGPWLNSLATHRHKQPWLTYGKLTDVVRPSPSMLWVFLDEDASGLNDAAFAFGMENPRWIDVPGSRHNFGAGFSFADGHSEIHAWSFKDRKDNTENITDPQDRIDWEWMRQRTSARADR